MLVVVVVVSGGGGGGDGDGSSERTERLKNMALDRFAPGIDRCLCTVTPPSDRP